jgi:hypothetical protein
MSLLFPTVKTVAATSAIAAANHATVTFHELSSANDIARTQTEIVMMSKIFFTDLFLCHFNDHIHQRQLQLLFLFLQPLNLGDRAIVMADAQPAIFIVDSFIGHSLIPPHEMRLHFLQ